LRDLADEMPRTYLHIPPAPHFKVRVNQELLKFQYWERHVRTLLVFRLKLHARLFLSRLSSDPSICIAFAVLHERLVGILTNFILSNIRLIYRLTVCCVMTLSRDRFFSIWCPGYVVVVRYF
jgi:hypothetical protein